MGSALRERSRPRTLFRAGATVLVALVLTACIAVALFTAVSVRHARRIVTLHDEMHAVDAVRQELTAVGRYSFLSALTEDPAYDRLRAQVEIDMLTHLAIARAEATTPRNRELLDRANAEIREYLLRRAEADSHEEPPAEAVVSLAPAMQRPLDTLEELGRVASAEIGAAEQRLARWELLDNILAISTAVLVLAGFVAVGTGLRRFVFAPLLALGDAIDRFASGDETTRVVPEGATDLRRTAERFNDIAERLARQKHDLLAFLGGVAHDLRNPLAAMRMGLRLLTREEPHCTEEQKRKTLALLDRQIVRLEHMVGDFLDATRIEAGHLELRPEERDAREIANEAVELYRSSGCRRIRFSAPDGPVDVRCDGERIAQVLNNLLSNAIKYSPKGGDVLVSVATAGDYAIISVQDAGIGIPPNEIERVFEPFHRTGASRETAPGVGLGLSVARRIVEEHGGTLEVESELGVGSTFRVRLPLAGPGIAVSATPALH